MAPSQPSASRWSTEIDRFIIQRTAISPLNTAGRCFISWTPRMATSGKLMIGVAMTPPSLPSDEIVKVEPVRSLRVALPSWTALPSRSSSAAMSKIERRSASRTTVTTRPCGPCAAMPTW
jgi:hypothetical protein